MVSVNMSILITRMVTVTAPIGRQMGKLIRSISVPLLIFAILTSSPGTGLASTTYHPPWGTWNGIKVYLSPAHHVPDNVGCDNYQESAGARDIALKVKDTLVSYGYQVRIGSGNPIDNTNDSNAWGSTVHIPIHSNAGPWDCNGQDSSRGGTWLIYADTPGYDLGVEILSAVGPYSPGTWDRICSDTSGCTSFTLHELRATNMPAAYVEAAFHTYGPDKNWLLQTTAVGTRIAVGIDKYFGSPRCPSPNNPCPMIMSPEPTLVSHRRIMRSFSHPVRNLLN